MPALFVKPGLAPKLHQPGTLHEDCARSLNHETIHLSLCQAPPSCVHLLAGWCILLSGPPHSPAPPELYM